MLHFRSPIWCQMHLPLLFYISIFEICELKMMDELCMRSGVNTSLKTTAALASILEVKLQENLWKWGKHEKMEQFTFMEETLHLEKYMEYLRNIEARIYYYILHILYNYSIYQIYSPVGSIWNNMIVIVLICPLSMNTKCVSVRMNSIMLWE